MAKKVLAVIRPTNTNCANMLIGAYTDISTGTQYAISRDGSTHKVYDNNIDKYFPIIELFDSRNRKQYVIDIDMDLPKDEYEIVLEQKKREIAAWKQHNQIICSTNMNHERNLPDYNKNLKAVNFILEVPEVTVKKRVSTTNLKGSIFNHFSSLRLSRKRDVALYFEVNPTGFTEDELFDKMCNFETGVLMQDGNMEKYKEIFIDNITPDIDVEVVIRKAIYYTDNCPLGQTPIFTKHGNAYFYHSTYLGENATDVMNFFLHNNNSEIYESYVLRRVKEIESVLIDIDKKVVGVQRTKDVMLVEKGENLVERNVEEESFIELDKETGDVNLAIRKEKKAKPKTKNIRDAAYDE